MKNFVNALLYSINQTESLYYSHCITVEEYAKLLEEYLHILVEEVKEHEK